MSTRTNQEAEEIYVIRVDPSEEKEKSFFQNILQSIKEMDLRTLLYYKMYGDMGKEKAYKENNKVAKTLFDLFLLKYKTQLDTMGLSIVGIPDSKNVRYMHHPKDFIKQTEIVGEISRYDSKTYTCSITVIKKIDSEDKEIFFSFKAKSPVVG